MIVPETRKDNIASSCRVTVDVNGVEGFEEISRSLFALIDSGTSFGLEKNSLPILKRGAVGEAMPGSPCWQRGLPFGFEEDDGGWEDGKVSSVMVFGRRRRRALGFPIDRLRYDGGSDGTRTNLERCSSLLRDFSTRLVLGVDIARSCKNVCWSRRRERRGRIGVASVQVRRLDQGERHVM